MGFFTSSRFLTTKEADIGQAAAEALADLPASSASWEAVNLYNKAGALTWPITMMTYMYVRQDMTALGATGTLLKVCDSSAHCSPVSYSLMRDFVRDDVGRGGPAACICLNPSTAFCHWSPLSYAYT